jgi:stage IV sporulation protein FB
MRSIVANPQFEIRKRNPPIMLLGEPAATQADLHFRVFGFPVRVHPFFWVVALLLGMGGREAEPVIALIWVAVVFVSILVHELGHAFVQRYYGGRPWITLYSFGGLASCDDCDRSPRAQILISLAGPFAGFFLAGFLISILIALQRFQGFELDWIPVLWTPFESRQLEVALRMLMFVNIAWGVLNLLPIYPLDGGRIARELFTLGNPRAGVVQSLQLSAGAAVLVAVYALTQQAIFMTIMFGFLAYGSFQTLQMYQNRWR